MLVLPAAEPGRPTSVWGGVCLAKWAGSRLTVIMLCDSSRIIFHITFPSFGKGRSQWDSLSAHTLCETGDHSHVFLGALVGDSDLWVAEQG